jgi:hypothetical protein
MSLLSVLGWNNNVQTSLSMSKPRFAITCGIAPLPRGGPLKLQIKHAALGLWQAGMALSQNKFYQLYVDLSLQGETVGWVGFAPQKPSSAQNIALTNSTVSSEAIISNKILTADFGIVVDPAEPEFSISYQFDGIKIKAQDIFTSFLDAMTISAQYDNYTIGAEIHAAKSISGDVVLSTWEIGDTLGMTRKRLKRALIIIREGLIIGKQHVQPSSFEGTTFRLSLRGKSIGAGRILKFNSVESGTPEIEVPK